MMGSLNLSLDVQNISIAELEALRAKLLIFIQNNPNVRITGFSYNE